MTCTVPGCGASLPCRWHRAAAPRRVDAPAIGRALRDRGKDQIEGRDEFVASVRAALQAYSLQHGDVTNDDARRIADTLGLRPKHKNAWGAIFRGEGWEHVGWRPSGVVSNHAHLNRVWRYRVPALAGRA